MLLAYCRGTFQIPATIPVSRFLAVMLLALLWTPVSSIATQPAMSATTDNASATPAHLADLEQRFGPSPGGVVVIVDVSSQMLSLYRGDQQLGSWPISTSQFGIGNRLNSQQTPLGVHRVARKIGAGAPLGTLFRARRDTGRTVTILKDDRAADGDYVTSRILWLKGLEPGVNQGPGVDSFHRYIYIHGTAEEGRIGRPASHGCIRMRNRDVIDLFQQVPDGALVEIRR